MLKILIVEDNEDDLYLLQRNLKTCGLRDVDFQIARYLKEAIEKTRNEFFDGVIADLGLPDAQGFDTIDEITNIKGTALIVLTGRDDDRLLEKMSSAGVHDYLVKSDLNAGILRRSILYSLKRLELDQEKEQFFVSSIESEKMRTLGLMAGGISHDFNNKLAILSSNIDLAVHNVGDIEKVRCILIEMRQTIQLAASLPQKLLAFSKNKPTETKDIVVEQAVQESLQLLRNVVGNNVQMKFVSHLPPKSIALLGEGDLDQIITNLVINSCDAIEGEGEVVIIIEPNNDSSKTFTLTVSDTGRGISEDQLDSIFEPFFSTKKGFLASGLGLSIAKSMVLRNRGKISCESDLGKGATFRVRLPLKSAPN